MKTLKTIIISLAVLATLTLVVTYLMTGTFIPCKKATSWTSLDEHLQGQDVIASSKVRYMTFATYVRYDEQSQKTTIVWGGNEADWDNQESPLWFDDVPTVQSEVAHIPTEPTEKRGLIGLSWNLINEGEYTVLHCYMTMQAGEVKNLWLASEETAIVDLSTGKNYRAIRCVPDCMSRNFGVRSDTAAMLDFQIYFPKLPATTTDIAIYGVPTWHMRGMKAKIDRTVKQPKRYDALPKFHAPRLIQPENNYNKDDGSTWAVYTDPHMIKPAEEGTMALWLTPEATYLAYAHEQNWMREYFSIHPGIVLFDEHGNQYKLRETLGLPSNNHLFWIDGYSGDHIAFVHVFDPLSADAQSISFIEPDGEPFEAWGANWKGQSILNLDIDELRQNQSLFEYNKRELISK